MQYELKGGAFPVVVCRLNSGESMITEKGSMVWMTPNMEMTTTGGGGIGKMFSKALTGESMFQNIYTARGEGMITFGSSFPGQILPLEVTPGKSFILQKSAFLASEAGVQLSMHVNQKLGAGFFGGEGFIMQKLSGRGLAFLEIDGSAVEHELAAGERLIVDTGYLAMMSESCSIDIQSVKGVKNVLFGGEGLFNTVVTGPGKIVLQTMPLSSFVGTIAAFLPQKN